MCRHFLDKDPWYESESSDEEEAKKEAKLEMYTGRIRKPDKYFRDKLGELKLTCPFDDCGRIIDYSSFLAHKKSCKFDPETITYCKYCNVGLKRKNIRSHLKKCVEYKFATLKTEMSEMKKSFDKKLAAKDEENSNLKRRVERLEKKCPGMKRACTGVKIVRPYR